ncbi:MAG: hypothetical protein NC310_03895 [Roseburia sp.]|nr:hypothetical protein [Anaeroplasma bactoclasticum]MCM1196202.1 hypothetical protein [Roseburia sp.]MCM1556031.1 hypothetical protein [Anaeroplasma bactoclasticum]
MKANIEFFNVDEFISTDAGVILYRYKESTILKLGYKESIKGQEKAKIPAMVEIRALTYSKSLKITLKALDAHMKVFCYIDDFQNGEVILNQNEEACLEFKIHDRMEKMYENIYKKKPYLWRIILGNGSRVLFKKLEAGKLFPIEKKRPWVLYGSSISQGAGALDIVNCYAFLTSQALKIDILNKGLAGSCLLERTTVDYLASIPCCGYILEIGANVRGLMEADEFQIAFSYLIDKLAERKLPIFLISILDMFESLYCNFKEIPYHDKNVKFIEIMKNKVASMHKKNLYLLSSADCLNEIDGISADMLHPSNKGHMLLAKGLVEAMRNLNH